MNEEMAKKIRDRMKQLHITQLDVEIDTGICSSSLSNWLNGNVIPRLDGFLKLIDYLKMDLEIVDREVLI